MWGVPHGDDVGLPFFEGCFRKDLNHPSDHKRTPTWRSNRSIGERKPGTVPFLGGGTAKQRKPRATRCHAWSTDLGDHPGVHTSANIKQNQSVNPPTPGGPPLSNRLVHTSANAHILQCFDALAQRHKYVVRIVSKNNANALSYFCDELHIQMSTRLLVPFARTAHPLRPQTLLSLTFTHPPPHTSFNIWTLLLALGEKPPTLNFMRSVKMEGKKRSNMAIL